MGEWDDMLRRADRAAEGLGSSAERFADALAAARAELAEVREELAAQEERAEVWKASVGEVERMLAEVKAKYNHLVEQLRKAEQERDRHGECICNTGPDTDGPDEFCPRHGRPYSEVLGIFNREVLAMRAAVERESALRKVLNQYFSADPGDDSFLLDKKQIAEWGFDDLTDHLWRFHRDIKAVFERQPTSSQRIDKETS